jgi:NAD(P)-dependent dehydrogenase (short-subunit alcohol dehydrogenase family)
LTGPQICIDSLPPIIPPAGTGEEAMRLNGKVALVTGGAKGIGEAVVRRFAAEGARVVIADRDAQAGNALAEHDEALHFVECDVAAPGAAAALLEAVLPRFGRLDVLVNNAGITHAADFLELREEDFDRVLSVNLRAYFTIGQASARQMIAQGGGGAIVNMSSVNALLAIADQVPYVVSKGGVNQLTRVMALALAPHDIRVNAVGPGTIATELARKAVMGSEEARKRLLSRTPMGRLGEPDEVAKVVLFLASEDASYLTGQIVYPDGGRMALNYTVPVD